MGPLPTGPLLLIIPPSSPSLRYIFIQSYLSFSIFYQSAHPGFIVSLGYIVFRKINVATGCWIRNRLASTGELGVPSCCKNQKKETKFKKWPGGRGLEVVANVHLLKQVSIPQAGFQTLKPSPIWPYLPIFPNLLLLPQIHKWNSLNELGSFIPKWFQPPPGFICKLLSYILSYILPIKTQTFERCGKLTGLYQGYS